MFFSISKMKSFLIAYVRSKKNHVIFSYLKFSNDFFVSFFKCISLCCVGFILLILIWVHFDSCFCKKKNLLLYLSTWFRSVDGCDLKSHYLYLKLSSVVFSKIFKMHPNSPYNLNTDLDTSAICCPAPADFTPAKCKGEKEL